MIGRLYRGLVPAGVRGRVWDWRQAAWALATDPARRREHLARWWVAVGRPVRRVRVGHARLTVDVRDIGVGRKIYVRREYEAAEAAVLRAELRPGMTYLDVGANLGYLATLAAGLVGQTGRVIAVEPEPYNFGLLTRNLRANPAAPAEPVNAAAGAAAGVARLFKAAANLGDHRLYSDADSAGRPAVEVPVVRLDDLFAARGWPPPDFVKVDVQGYEPFAVAGLDRLVAAGRPMTVLTEYWPIGIRNAGGDQAAYRAWFRDRGFACHRIDADGRTVPVAADRVDDHLPPLNPAWPDGQMLNLVFRR
jgi:FkbM family methyltransferase